MSFSLSWFDVAQGFALCLALLHCSVMFHPSTHDKWVGAFACQRAMFYRGRLPHGHPDLTEASFLFVTWRLAAQAPARRIPQALATFAATA
jgi:hypothetical protein